MAELLQSPLAQLVVPILVVVLVAGLILKLAKGCLKFLIVIIIIAALVVYVIPHFL